VLAYELVTGSVPFEAPTLTGVLMKHLSEKPVPPSVRCPHPTIPKRLEALILRALEKDPSRRPQSMEAIREELLQVAQELGVAPRFTPVPVAAIAPPKAYAPTPVPSSPAFESALAPTWIPSAHPSPVPRAPQRKRRTGRWVAAGVVGVLLAAGVFRHAWVPLLPAGLAASEGRLEARIQRAVHALRSPPPAKPPAPGIAATVKPPGPTAAAQTPPVQTAPAQVPQVAAQTQSPPVTTPPATPQKENPVESASHKRPAEPAVQHPVARHPSYLTASDIGRTMRRSGPRLRQCLKQFASALPDKKGQLTLNVSVANSGEVEGAGFAAKELVGSPFEGCVVSAIKELKFPAHTNARNNHFEVPIEYGVKD
jgi:hypothetical protein